MENLYFIIGVVAVIIGFIVTLYYSTHGRNATFEETQDFLLEEPESEEFLQEVQELTDAIVKPTLNNAIMILNPYWLHGTWVFDEPALGLKAEAFVGGADKQISYLVKKYNINNPEAGFKVHISANWFPDCQAFIEHISPDEYGSGNYYRLTDGDVVIDGWYCGVLLMYFKTAPEKIYCKVESL